MQPYLAENSETSSVQLSNPAATVSARGNRALFMPWNPLVNSVGGDS